MKVTTIFQAIKYKVLSENIDIINLSDIYFTKFNLVLMKKNPQQIFPNKLDQSFLDAHMLSMPIKKSKQIKDLLRLKMEQQKIIDQMHSKSAFKLPLSATQKKLLKNSILQSDTPIKSTDSSYLMNCITRALKFRKLSIDDIGQIFEIEPQYVEEIDRFRRLKQFQTDQNSSTNAKIQMQRQRIIRNLQNRIKNKHPQKGGNNKIDNFDNFSRQSQSKTSDMRSLSYSHQNNSLRSDKGSINMNQSQVFSDLNDMSCIFDKKPEQQEQNLYEYQRLLRHKPPHRLDQKMIAIVDVLKKRPNLLQKEIIDVVLNEYGVKGLNQTSISRYLKRIYDMKQHVNTLIQAQKDGHILF